MATKLFNVEALSSRYDQLKSEKSKHALPECTRGLLHDLRKGIKQLAELKSPSKDEAGLLQAATVLERRITRDTGVKSCTRTPHKSSQHSGREPGSKS